MYRQLFGFSKNPFRQTPDPAYLFLGQNHEEAIAHLTYAVMKGEGFSVITGEPGVGKTTVCRSFLEQLDHNIQSAYIHDARGLNPLQLLNRINTTLQIPGKYYNIKDLTDTLNEFLIQKTRAGQKVALFIDDAHELSSEVLEQVRLLSNLETTRHKLLQIILIGRPELSDRLDSRELRQIGQRVSVNWYINPLSYEETLAYVQHRISVASEGPPVRFDQSAVRPLYRFTNGIPRRINSACDRILKEAYDHRERIIGEKIAKSALKKLAGHWGKEPKGFYRWTMLLGGAGCLALIAIIGGAYVMNTSQAETPQAVVLSRQIAPLPNTQAAAEQPVPAESPVLEQENVDIAGNIAVEELSDAIIKSSFGGEDVAPERELASVATDIVNPNNTEAEDTAVDESSSRRLTHSVQVGAFLEETNALKQVKLLEKTGYQPHILTVTGPDGRTWFTVRIGDYPSIEMARQQSDAFTTSENTASAVRPYNAF